MNFKANYEAINITSASTFSYVDAMPTTATTVHQIFCLTAGSITITALGGGQFTWAATSGQEINVLVAIASATTGSFIGFRSKFYATQGGPFYN